MTTQAGAGLSTDVQAIPAARAAATRALQRCGTPSADWAVVFITSSHRPHFAAMLAEIQRTLGTEVITGCSALGVLIGSQEVEGRPGVAVLAVRSDRLSCATFLAPLNDGGAGGAALEVARHLQDRGPGLMVLLPDPSAARPDHLLYEIGRCAPEREAVGGAA